MFYMKFMFYKPMGIPGAQAFTLSLSLSLSLSNWSNYNSFLSNYSHSLEPQRELIFHAPSKTHRVAVREHPNVRGHSLFSRMFFQAAEHPPFACCPQNAVIGEMHPSEKIHARSETFDKNFVWMKSELEALAEKFANLRYQVFQILFITRKNREIVGITEIIFYLQSAFHKLVKLVHINVNKYLRSEIAERQTHAQAGRGETLDDFPQKPDNFFVGNVVFQNAKYHSMVNVRKKFLDIAFQNPNCFRAIYAFFACKRTKTIQCFVRSLASAARIRISDKRPIEKRIEFSVKRMV